MIVFADLHLDVDSADVCFGQILPGILAATKLHNDQQVAFLGDWWHLRYRVVVRLQVAVRDVLRRWGEAGVQVRILAGNHDQVNFEGRNALEVFDDLPYVRVYSKPTIDADGLWLPYRKRQEDLAAPLRQWREQRNGEQGTIFMHHGIEGAWMNDGVRAKEGLPLAMFANGESVLLGHYHKRQQLKDRLIWYIGSPRQVTAREAGQETGYAVWNGRRLQWVTTQWGPRFHKLGLPKDGVLDLSGVKAGDDVRVQVDNEQDCLRVAKELDALSIRHTVTPRIEASASRLAVAGGGLRDYAVAYANERGESMGLDPEALVARYDQFVQETVT